MSHIEKDRIHRIDRPRIAAGDRGHLNLDRGSTTLSDQDIVTSDDACLPGRVVADPFTAYCQAKVIEKHTLEQTGGLTYAELDRDDPLREVALTSSFLQSSLFTSIVAFGVAAMAVGMGILFILIGLGIRDVAERTAEPIPV